MTENRVVQKGFYQKIHVTDRYKLVYYYREASRPFYTHNNCVFPFFYYVYLLILKPFTTGPAGIVILIGYRLLKFS